MLQEHSLFTERHRPQTIADTILPKKVEAYLNPIINGDGSFPNMLFSGVSGTGKTTAAKALARDLNIHEPLVINGSLNRGIDMVRHDIPDYATGMSLYGGRKLVIIDEADFLTEEAQVAMRNLMESFSKNCGFILTSNFPNRIIDALLSRCSQIVFAFDEKEKKSAMRQQLNRALEILDAENIQYDMTEIREQLGTIILRHFPDFRRVLNIIDSASKSGTLDPLVLTDNSNKNTVDQFLFHVKDKNFTQARKWIGENITDTNVNQIFTIIYDKLNTENVVSEDTLPNAIVLLGQYQFYAGNVVDQEINMAALAAELMAACNFN